MPARALVFHGVAVVGPHINAPLVNGVTAPGKNGSGVALPFVFGAGQKKPDPLLPS